MGYLECVAFLPQALERLLGVRFDARDPAVEIYVHGPAVVQQSPRVDKTNAQITSGGSVSPAVCGQGLDDGVFSPRLDENINIGRPIAHPQIHAMGDGALEEESPSPDVDERLGHHTMRQLHRDIKRQSNLDGVFGGN
ncbi:hypothetical protein HMPREF2863_06290 [Micrococcus sp. HMSC067E09]|nr:hypothetical protein HMPREF2863_06290 [Micrococcus sp. HMSC067E09]